LASLDARLLQDALRGQALRTSYCTELGVVSSVELVHDAGDSTWKNVRDRELLRENGWASRY
jgi:hypothetical protein